MKVILSFQDNWEVVENGHEEPTNYWTLKNMEDKMQKERTLYGGYNISMFCALNHKTC